MNITEFLRARLDEDASDKSLWVDYVPIGSDNVATDAEWARVQAQHEALEERVRREIAAKMVALLYYEEHDTDSLAAIVEAMACVYSDHPDFNPAWA
ncbi:DUF6221 family protein [Ornithinimicrobium sp. LYQ92]|uniref:DUF6221 family protein n=1 Tax=Serinicoccus sp. LYQ92 TaxID=3378798 RepID=UPI003851ED07